MSVIHINQGKSQSIFLDCLLLTRNRNEYLVQSLSFCIVFLGNHKQSQILFTNYLVRSCLLSRPLHVQKLLAKFFIKAWNSINIRKSCKSWNQILSWNIKKTRDPDWSIKLLTKYHIFCLSIIFLHNNKIYFQKT